MSSANVEGLKRRVEAFYKKGLVASLGLLLVPASLVAPLAAQTASGPASLAGLLSSYGIRPIDPPSPAGDFRLPDLRGGETALSDFYGSWVVLTFFATWCGPCRSELPTLEKLHQTRAERGVVVLGVSIDDTRQPLDPFVRQLRLSFPILWDQTQEVGAKYRASSIPISYLVDPEGRLVGVSRGARDWSALVPMMDAALGFVPASLSAEANPAAYADGDLEVATPTVSDPPTAEVAVETETPVAGRPFYMDIKLHWAGNFEEYLPHPPEILLPEGVVQESVTAESSSRDGRNFLTYRATLRAEKPGKYALDPVEVRYTPRFEQTPVAGRVLGPTVEVVAPKILGLPPGVLAVSAAAFIFLGLVGYFAARRWSSRKSATGSGTAEIYAELQGEFEEARKKRLQGDSLAYYLGLMELDEKLRAARQEGELDAEVKAAREDAIDRARFGGEVPDAQDLEKLHRKIERRLEDLRPGREKNERENLKFRDSE